jgi:four helix bundle protein
VLADVAGMTYNDWLKTVPEEFTADALWKVEAYRLSMFVVDIGWHDVTRLMQDKRTVKLAAQLYSALGSVGANVSEGYSRGGGRDRARFYEFALGSARESRGWYFDGRHILPAPVVTHRYSLLTQIIRLLLTMIPDQREHSLREESVSYLPDRFVPSVEFDPLTEVPLP